jgi:hypothetical protein
VGSTIDSMNNGGGGGGVRHWRIGIIMGWKLVMDRMLPISYFEKDKAGGGRNSVSISITGVGGETTVIGSTLAGEFNAEAGEEEDED